MGFFMSILQDPAVFVAIALLTAIVGGTFASMLHMPRVVGYLVAGVALHGLLTWIDTAENPLASEPPVASAMKSLALGLIMFQLGGAFEAKHLRTVGLRILRISSFELACVFVAVTAACSLFWMLNGPQHRDAALTAGVLLGVLALATAPAATVLVLGQYDARGPMSDAIQTLTAINNAVCIVLFHIALLILGALGWIGLAGGGERILWLDLLCTSVGSVALGGVLGIVLSAVYARRSLSEFVIVFLAVVLGVGALQDHLAHATHLSLNALLTCLFIGAAFANVAANQDPLHETLAVLGKPIYACFFVIAGFELHLSSLPAIGLIGAAYIITRVLGKVLGGWLGARHAAASFGVHPYVGLGLLCQAGVAIGLADVLCASWGRVEDGQFLPDPAAEQLKAVILGSVVVFELFGPIVLKWVAIRSGEVKAVTLLAPHRRDAGAAASLPALFQSLTRGFGIRAARVKRGDPETLCVWHIMRSNLRLLPASARFDQVLHYVERSRDHQFPVVDDDGYLVGMVHFADLREMLYDPVLRELVTAHDLARADTPRITREMPLDALFDKFRRADVGTLPVVDADDRRKVVGIVEQRDLLKALHEREDASV